MFQLIWALILVFSLQPKSSISQKLTCNSDDYQALVGFSKGLDSAIDGWDSNSSNCCNWTGINCNEISGRVVKLELVNKKLAGNVSKSIGLLDNLKTLNLSTNFLKGSIPVELFNLVNLEVIDLSSNELTGTIPMSINLPFVKRLNLSVNQLMGQIPLGICNNLTQIRTIDFSCNNLSGIIPQGFGNCILLEELFLNSNNFVGIMPEIISGLSYLSKLSLSGNGLTGHLSSSIGNLSNLVYFDISTNWFSGEIPDVFYEFTKLHDFSAGSNNFSGKIPNSLSNSKTLNSLSFNNNSLSGQININCSAMISLVSLDLGSNLFSGPFPDNLPLCPNLETLNLARNKFRSEIPESFSHFHSLYHLSLSSTALRNLSSALRILQKCQNLTTLVLTTNFENELLPYDSSLQFKTLKTLIIANCGLTGSIPQWLSGSTKLQLLDISWNKLSGTIPLWFGNFEFLFYVDLSNNSFTGEIPKNLTEMKSLIHGNWSLEDTVSDFPFFLKKSVNSSGLQYNQVGSFPPTLDFGNNFLSGPIWAQFGNLKDLHVLNLKCNNLSGYIPSALSGMTSVEILDFSHNNLSGAIPQELVSLSFLSQFSVAYNNLDGEIPSGGQFETFQNSSFEGNIGLCGEHALMTCSNDDTSNKSNGEKSKHIGMGIGIGLGSVFLLGLIFVIIICFSRRQEVDPEKDEASTSEKYLEQIESKLVVLFQDKDKELSVDNLLKYTNNFDQANIIGCGGFGLVYKATLPDNTKLAIKRLSNEGGQMEREFKAEVETLSRAQHPNLVLLQGYCSYKTDRILIYTYMENGSLDFWLHERIDGPPLLDWDTRLKIAQGAARGLAYLHQSCEPRILHRDIKSSNILLDKNFEAHLADFGLARLIQNDNTHVSTDLVGTMGYIPPEYSQAAVASYKGDVYSFGVVLLELLTGKRPMDMCKPKGARDLISWVLLMKKEKKESEVFDPFVYDKENSKAMMRVLEIACLCLSEFPKLRPCTEQLVSWLDNVA